MTQEDWELHKKQCHAAVIKATSNKFQTAFIYALAEIEKDFGHLWDENSADAEVETPEFYKELYHKLRKRVLDNGNNQIRLFQKEMDCFEVAVKRQTVYFTKDGKPNG